MQKTLPYKSKVIEKKTLKLSKKSIFKVYFLNILNRDEKAKYMWEYSTISMNNLLQNIELLKPKGIGFIIAFPHICKIFRFGPEIETNLYFISYDPNTMEKIILGEEKWIEIACSAEIAIAADKFYYWGQNMNVKEYLEIFSERGDVEIKDHNKLYRFLSF